ncbi:hypothetical protein evm_005841 [Chilo suppressalis]|nr:hypothetical protein evm_005841 [Chilo suppressalis]
MPFYAVAKGRAPGIFMSWGECEAQVKGFSGARYKKFDSQGEAQDFINSVNSSSGSVNAVSKPKTVYPKSNRFSKQTNNNLKRSYLSNTIKDQNNSKWKPASSESNSDSSFLDDSDDLNTILTKQLDDVEKRLKISKENVDKIINKSTKSSGRKTILIEPHKPKRSKTGLLEFEEDFEGFVKVYTDGACSSNGSSVAKAGLGVYWGDGHFLNVSEPVTGRATNNCGEIQAATKAIRIALDNDVKKLSIYTDSQFLINSVTKWMKGWKRSGWQRRSGDPVKNEIDFKELDSVMDKLEIKWIHVDAHKGIHGNEMADKLAKAGAAMYGL